MVVVNNFEDFLSKNENPLYESVKNEYFGIDSVMNKVARFAKMESALHANIINESFFAMQNHNQNIYFSTEERKSIGEMFEEFIPNIANAFIEELVENNCIFDELILSEIGFNDIVNEGWFTSKIKNAYDNVVSKTKSIANKIGDKISDTKDYIEDKTKEIAKATKETTKKIVDKYKSIISFIKELISKGVASVKDFIASAGKLFDKLGNGLSEGLKKLGAFKIDKDEEKAPNITDKTMDGLAEDEGEKNFLQHVIAYMGIMMSNKEKTDKLINENFQNYLIDFSDEELNENKVLDKIANNKFIQFILCYGKDRKISIWRSILISIAGSLIISFGLPIILSVCGVGAAAIPVCVACVRIVWSARSAFKVLLNRYVNKKQGEKFWDKKTIIMLLICILPQIPPFKDWIADAFSSFMKWIGADKWIENLEEWLGKLIGTLHGKNPSIETFNKVWEERLSTGGGHQAFTNWKDNIESWMTHAKDCGTDAKGMNFVEKIVKGAQEIKGSTNFHKYWNEVIDKFGGDAPHGMIVDTSKHGVNSIFYKAMKEVADSGKYPGMSTGVIGGEVWHSATKRFAGSCNMVYNMPDGAKEDLIEAFKKLGGNPSDLHITEYGKGVVEQVTKHVEVVTKPVHWLFDTLVASFSPVFIPFFDKKKWGKYAMCFGSNTSKLKYHTVVKVEEMSFADAESKYAESDNIAVQKLKSHINSIQNVHSEFIKMGEEQGEEKSIGKKILSAFKKDQNKNYEENNDLSKRPVMVIFVDYEKKNGEIKENVPGVMFDTLSMMGADICPMRVPRRNPYYMKGLLSRLSFKPVDKKDNETKSWIESLLANTLATAVKQNYSYSLAGCLIKKEGKEYIPNDDNQKNTTENYIGNFSVEELCTILNDNTKEKTDTYEFISGKYGSRTSGSKKGDVKVKHDRDTIENRRYLPADTKIEDDKEKVVRTKNGKIKKKYSEMKKYQGDKYGYRLATPEEKESKDSKLLDYVDAKLIPLMNDKKTKLHKALYADDKIKHLFFDVETEKVDEGLIDAIREYLFRAEVSFPKKDVKNAIEKINDYLKENNRNVDGETKLGKEYYNVIKNAVETIWELKSKHSSAKRKPKKKVNESIYSGRFMKFEDFINR